MNTLSDLIDAALEFSVVGSFSRIGRRSDGALVRLVERRRRCPRGPNGARDRADIRARFGHRSCARGHRRTGRAARSRRGPAARVERGSGCDARRRPLPDRRRRHGIADVGPGRRSMRILATEERLDVVVDNAGAMFRTRVEGPDGIEATVALMVAGPFVLIGGLLPLLERTDGSRVIAVTSGGMYTQALDLDDLESRDEPFSGPRAYARAKRAQVDADARMVAPARAGRCLVQRDASGLGRHAGAGRVAARGSTGRWGRCSGRPRRASTRSSGLRQRRHRDRRSGQLFLDRRPRPFDRVPTTRLGAADRRRLWDIVVAMTGGPDPAPSA